MTANRNAHIPEEIRTPEPRGDAGSSDAQRALLARRRVSIRARIVAVFILIFLFLSLITIAALAFLAEFKSKSAFLENMASYVFEIQQARRFEKNFFLYGTDLADALANTHNARNYLTQRSEAIQSVIGEARYLSMKETLTEYEKLLEELLESGEEAKPESDARYRQIEVCLRRYGAQIVTDAEDMIDRERLSMHSMLDSSKLVLLFFLVFMFFAMACIAAFIIRTILTPLGRFVRYAGRIGMGDYSPIQPVRRFRDEFSDLAIAVNQMLRELKIHQDQLMQSRKMAAVGSLTSGIAHELNNPLNNIGLNTEALIEGFGEYTDEEKLNLLEQIFSQVERASATVRNLLDFTRKELPTFTTLSIEEVLESTVKLVRNEMLLAGVELHQDVDRSLPRLRGNPSNLQQVFLNLLLNAIHAMPDGGRIDVAAGVHEEFVRVDVRDTGCGIPKEHLEKVFDPFFTTKEPGLGTGLGLSVSYGIIERHGGKITVESEPGEGTTLSVFLPIEEDQ